MNSLRTMMLLVATTALAACQSNAVDEPADIILINGGIYTVDAEYSWAEAAAIRDGEIIAVGSNKDILKFQAATTETIDIDGGIALPGFNDTHTHPLEGGYSLQQCMLTDEQQDSAAVFARIRDCTENTDREWVMATGLDLAMFEQNGPDKALLDEISTKHFFFIIAADGHSVLVNDRVLDLAGIDGDTPDPEYGVIERREGSNEPNGTLRESAYDLVDALRPERTLDESIIAMRTAVKAMNAVGITSASDVWAGEHELQVWKALDDAEELTLRVMNSIIDEGVFEKHSGDDFERVLESRAMYSSDLINNDGIKIMVDGVLEGESASLVHPYVDLGHRGTLNHTQEDLFERVARYDAMGLQIHMHTMGDGAARAGLDAIEFARQQNADNPASQDTRHVLSHLALISQDDAPRFAELNTSANFTAAWAYPDEWVIELNVPVIGQDRVDSMYPIQSIHRSGGNVVGGSDWIYGPLDPLVSIEVAVTRKSPDLETDLVGNIGDAVDLRTAIEMYTTKAAWLLHQENRIGSIEIGKRADLVVLDRNLFEIPVSEISDAEVLVTVFDGDIVYRAGLPE